MPHLISFLMHNHILFPSLLAIGWTQIIAFDQTLPVLTSPILQVRAGNKLYYQYAALASVTKYC